MIRLAVALIISVVLGAYLFLAQIGLAAQPSSQMLLSTWTWSGFSPHWTDADGVECLSDENYWDRTWVADKFSGTFTVEVYLCPVNDNAPSGADNMDIHAYMGFKSGSAELAVMYPDGSIVAMRPMAQRNSYEVCVVADWLDRLPGVYGITFMAQKAVNPVLVVNAEQTRPPLNDPLRYGEGTWNGCALSWWQR